MLLVWFNLGNKYSNEIIKLPRGNVEWSFRMENLLMVKIKKQLN